MTSCADRIDARVDELVEKLITGAVMISEPVTADQALERRCRERQEQVRKQLRRRPSSSSSSHSVTEDSTAVSKYVIPEVKKREQEHLDLLCEVTIELLVTLNSRTSQTTKSKADALCSWLSSVGSSEDPLIQSETVMELFERGYKPQPEPRRTVKIIPTHEIPADLRPFHNSGKTNRGYP